MCGIAGAFGFVDPAMEAAVTAMSDAQTSRGPDGDGFWTGSNNCGSARVAFAHRRLAIVDLSPAGAQPMMDQASGNVVVFNGEIYNFREIRRLLIKEGYKFDSDCDTEVLLKSYAHWGLDCLNHLRGMFAFAIWDQRRGMLHLARDRIGAKPLYFARLMNATTGRTTILFASELRALLASGLVPRRLDPAGLKTYLWNGFVTGPCTMISGVTLLDAGSTLSISDPARVPDCVRYWSLEDVEAGPGECREADIAAVLEESVRMRLVADVPLGIFLSGGIDSSVVAALAVKSRSSDSVRTFTIGFESARFDETRHAEAVAHALGTSHSTLRVSASMFNAGLQSALESIDQPTFDAINSYMISSVVRQAGLKVALAGTGGDELFGGYNSFRMLPRTRVLASCMRWVSPIVDSVLDLGRIRRPIPSQRRWGKLADALATGGSLLDLYQVSYALFTRKFQSLLAPEIMIAAQDVEFGIPAVARDRLSKLNGRRSTLQAISLLELHQFVGERLMRDLDMTSMAVSLEVREPLLDHLLIEKSANLNDMQRYRPLGRKAMLRRLALDGLDPELFDRPKSGFELPMAEWLKETMAEQMMATLNDADLCRRAGLDSRWVSRLWRGYLDAPQRMYWSRPWSIFVLLDWVRRHGATL